METTLHRLAYEFSLRALSQQEAALDELRSRTGTLLAASSLVVSFLGAQAIDHSGFGPAAALALATFIGSIVCCVLVLMPRAGLVFSLSGPVLFEREYGQEGGTDETLRRLAYWIDGFRADNEPVIQRLFSWYRLGAIALVVEVALWTLHLTR